MKKVHFTIPELGLTIYDRYTTYATDFKHFPSFIFWELVDLTTNFILIFILLVVWEFFGLRDLFF